jgi:RNA polymerase sigma factor (sigma-70 family)
MLKDLDKPDFVARLLAGKEDAFATLGDALFPLLRRRFINKWNFTHADSEDLAVHTLQKFYQSLHKTFDPDKGLVGYVFMIAERLALDHYHEIKNRSEEQFTYEQAASRDEPAAPTEEGEREPSPEEILVQRELEKLDEVNQRIIILRVRDEWKFAQIAEALGMTEKAVDNRFRRAVRKLKDGLEKAKAG